MTRCVASPNGSYVPQNPDICQAQIQSRYQTHRSTRNAKQKAGLLSAEFSGFSLDPVLYKIVNKPQDPDSIDTRNCLVFWARPPEHIKLLVKTIQEQLHDAAPR